MKNIQFLKIILIIVVTFGFISCGGGGGDSTQSQTNIDSDTEHNTTGIDNSDDTLPSDGDEVNENNTTTSPTELTNVNGSINGLYFSSTTLEEGEWLNLSTGESGEMYKNPPSDLDVIVPSQDGTEFIELFVNDIGSDETTSTIYIKDMRTGLVVDEFTISGKISGHHSIRFSPDKQTIALRRDPYDDYDYALTFYTRKGEYIASFADESVEKYDWLPDGRFVYFKNGFMYIGELKGANSIFGMPVASIAHIDGNPTSVKCSPDGKTVVFEMYTKTPIVFETSSYRDATVWSIDINGSNLEQVATTDQNLEDSRANNPLWSLDGNFLLISAEVFSAVSIIWDQSSDNPWTDYYDPSLIEDAFAFNSPGFMYIVSKDAKNVTLLEEAKSYPVITHNNEGKREPYEVSSLHIEPGAMLVPSIEPLKEEIAPVSDVLTGTLLYLKDTYKDEFRDKLTVMQYDMATQQESIFFQKSGDDFDDASYFSVSTDNQYFSHWHSESYDEKYLKIYDKEGTEQKSYQLVYEDYPNTLGKKLISAPVFSPQNADLILYLFEDLGDDDRIKAGVLDWKTGYYKMLYTGEFSSVTWSNDGSIIASFDKEVLKFEYKDGEFAEPVRLFTTPNKAEYLNVSSDDSKVVFTMSGRIFWSKIDGSEITQVTAPPATNYETFPVWSPDGKSITFMKDDERYIISSESQNLNIHLADKELNANKANFIVDDGGGIGYWLR